MKNVILPTDFSDNAWKAMSYAAQLFHSEACNFILVNTFSIPYSYSEAAVMPNVEPLKDDSVRELEKVLKRFKEFDHSDGSTFRCVSKLASLVDAIDTIDSEVKGQSMIVMGTKGAGGLGEMFLGTMTSHVINHSKLPVICVPNLAELNTPKNMMLALDSAGIDRMEEVQLLFDLATQHEATIKVVNVPLGEKEVLAPDSVEQFVVDHYLKQIPHTYHTLTGKYKEDLLTQFAERNGVDLIVMIKRDRGFWKNLFHRSLTKSMSFYCEKPLLVLRD